MQENSLTANRGAYEPGSFRDREARVFRIDDRVYRALGKTAKAEWDGLVGTRFFRELLDEGKLVRTELVDIGEVRAAFPDVESWEAVVAHEKIPFISYPYEWSFSMLKDAALLHLEILRRALEEGVISKDSSSYNVQWKGAQPVFIDTVSFEKLKPGETWKGYLQFCELFLYPLLLESHRNIPFQPWLRGSIDGLRVEDVDAIFGWGSVFRPGVLAHVKLQAMFQRRYGNTKKQVKEEIRKSGFDKRLILANINGLAGVIGKLKTRKHNSVWVNYQNDNTYDDAETRSKKRFVEEVAQQRKWGMVWDVGANTGTYSRIVAGNAQCVLAMDSDSDTVDRLYRDLKQEKLTNITPLVIDIKDPSPNRGWRGMERQSLEERGKPDLVLCLAVLHHVVISANIPMKEYIGWLADMKTAVVIEYVSKQDEMVRHLLRNKDDNYTDYDQDNFERYLGERFRIVKQEEIKQGERTLYYAEPMA